MTPFRYARDPLFLASCAAYAVNRWLLKPHSSSRFLHGQFNDLLLIPCALPLVLWLHRRLTLRSHDLPPTGAEIAWHVGIWSVLCEVIGPHLMHVTGDPWDVVAYAVGGAGAGLWWHRIAARCRGAR